MIVRDSQASPVLGPVESSSPSLTRLLALINRTFQSRDVSVKVLKRDCGIRDNNVSSTFRREVGMTIREYIECLRVQMACTLLDKGTVTANNVGYAVGYEHVQTFYRAFRRRLSCTPGEYLAKVERMRLTKSGSEHTEPMSREQSCA
jgi:transcriptional regulator GlxA family with amidase domain